MLVGPAVGRRFKTLDELGQALALAESAGEYLTEADTRVVQAGIEREGLLVEECGGLIANECSSLVLAAAAGVSVLLHHLTKFAEAGRHFESVAELREALQQLANSDPKDLTYTYASESDTLAVKKFLMSADCRLAAEIGWFSFLRQYSSN